MVSVLDLRSSLTDIARNTRGGEEVRDIIFYLNIVNLQLFMFFLPTNDGI